MVYYIFLNSTLKKELRIRLFNFDFTSISYVLIISSNLLILFNISFNDAYNPITLTYLIPFINFKFVGALLLFEWCCYSQNGFFDLGRRVELWASENYFVFFLVAACTIVITIMTILFVIVFFVLIRGDPAFTFDSIDGIICLIVCYKF